jgi:putative Mn2+ efflux pump MntP
MPWNDLYNSADSPFRGGIVGVISASVGVIMQAVTEISHGDVEYIKILKIATMVVGFLTAVLGLYMVVLSIQRNRAQIKESKNAYELQMLERSKLEIQIKQLNEEAEDETIAKFQVNPTEDEE